MVGGGGLELRAVDGERRHLDQAGLGAGTEHLAEEVSEGPLVADPEAGDRPASGAWFAQITLKATSSRQRRSIPRELRSPTQEEWRAGGSIAFGSWAARPCPSE
ncbi:hypothetical protein C2142_00180 [Streptomyces sp. CB01881]|nr:hypothetical protein C2142_00180 [Streptomyces sp. CB01881]